MIDPRRVGLEGGSRFHFKGSHWPEYVSYPVATLCILKAQALAQSRPLSGVAITPV